MGISQILLLQLHFDIYNLLNKLIFLHGLICPCTLIGPTSGLLLALVTICYIDSVLIHTIDNQYWMKYTWSEKQRITSSGYKVSIEDL